MERLLPSLEPETYHSWAKALAIAPSATSWYMTSVHLKKYEPIWSKNMALRVNDAGFILLAYVKGEYVGSQWAQYYVFNYVFEKNVKLHPGKNIISLWSATVGFPNYGG
ncbi:beta-galactosidase 15-like [Malus domestica]|uniref:beta-galactosidase 15-like n=1 Tax=Malus domestica TaxID=3750 RepID=UPI00397588FE